MRLRMAHLLGEQDNRGMIAVAMMDLPYGVRFRSEARLGIRRSFFGRNGK